MKTKRIIIPLLILLAIFVALGVSYFAFLKNRWGSWNDGICIDGKLTKSRTCLDFISGCKPQNGVKECGNQNNITDTCEVSDCGSPPSKQGFVCENGNCAVVQCKADDKECHDTLEQCSQACTPLTPLSPSMQQLTPANRQLVPIDKPHTIPFSGFTTPKFPSKFACTQVGGQKLCQFRECNFYKESCYDTEAECQTKCVGGYHIDCTDGTDPSTCGCVGGGYRDVGSDTLAECKNKISKMTHKKKYSCNPSSGACVIDSNCLVDDTRPECFTQETCKCHQSTPLAPISPAQKQYSCNYQTGACNLDIECGTNPSLAKCKTITDCKSTCKKYVMPKTFKCKGNTCINDPINCASLGAGCTTIAVCSTNCGIRK